MSLCVMLMTAMSYLRTLSRFIGAVLSRFGPMTLGVCASEYVYISYKVCHRGHR